MPELPEVETIVRGLAKAIIPCHIINIIKSNNKLRIQYPDDFTKNLLGAKIINARRIAKYIVLDTDRKNSIVIHLGMSGRLLIVDSVNIQRGKHDHCVFELSNEKGLIYNDPRRFGLITLIRTQDINKHPLFKDMGIDPFAKEFDQNYLSSKVRDKKSAIKTVLMNSKFVTGIGNIYANEALFLAKISPFREAGSLNIDEVKKLVQSIRTVLNKGIEMGGSSLKDYVAPNGMLGNFQNHFQVYGRANQQCLSCGGIIVRKLFGQRATFYCSNCQKKTTA
jgi:formamidopyrimidine-DNA glycosylase